MIISCDTGGVKLHISYVVSYVGDWLTCPYTYALTAEAIVGKDKGQGMEREIRRRNGLGMEWKRGGGKVRGPVGRGRGERLIEHGLTSPPTQYRLYG